MYFKFQFSTSAAKSHLCAKFVFQFSISAVSQEAFLCTVCFSILNFNGEEALVCTICISIFNFSGEEAFVCTICISIFNFSGEEAGDQSGGAAAADTISTPCPQHTSLRDSLDQKRVPENFVFLGEIFIHVTHFRDSFNQRGPQNPGQSRAKKIPSSTIPPKTPHLAIPSIRSVDMSSTNLTERFTRSEEEPQNCFVIGDKIFLDALCPSLFRLSFSFLEHILGFQFILQFAFLADTPPPHTHIHTLFRTKKETGQ